MSDVLEGQLIGADDRVNLSRWVPPQSGILPHLRIGKRWFNLFWLVPVGGGSANRWYCDQPGATANPRRGAVRFALSRHTRHRSGGQLRVSLVAAMAALFKSVLHDVHHPRRPLGSSRPPSPVLEA